MSTLPRVLLFGGHGKVALHMTPLLLSKGYHLTSVIRNPDHKPEIESLASSSSSSSPSASHKSNLSIVISSVEDLTSTAAADLLSQTRPSIVIWSAGAGGKGGAARTKAVDETAAKHVISASVSDPRVKKFLMVSYIGSRRGRAPWWNDEDWESVQRVNTEVLPAYAAAKIEADEHLLAVTRRRTGGEKGDKEFQMINLRPGSLTDEPASGKVVMGKTRSRGKVSREDVARVAVELVSRGDTRGYFDLLGGEESDDGVGEGIKDAVDRLMREEHDGLAGEDMERIYAREV